MDVKEAAVEYLPEIAPQTREDDVPPGYKRTEVGVIPEDWSVDCIENFAHITTGSRNTQDRVDYGHFPFFVRSQNVENINSYSFDGEAVLTAGDGVGTGKVFHYINGKFDVHQRVYQICDFDSRVNGFFFFLYFSEYFYGRIMQMTARSSVDSVRREMISQMLVPLPSEAEQHAIATALSDADALIAALQRLIAKKRAIKQGTMQALLTGRQRLPGFSGAWETKTLDQLGTFRKGQGISRAQAQSGSLPCVRYGELYTIHHDYIRIFVSRISAEVAAFASKVGHGDILFAGSGETKEEIGKCAAIVDDITAYAGGDIVIFRINQGSALFFGYVLNTAQVSRQKASLGQGDAVVHISARALKRVSITIPEPDEQTTIATVFADMDAEIEALEARLAKTRALKAGMMQQLLTGRIRLPLEDAA